MRLMNRPATMNLQTGAQIITKKREGCVVEHPTTSAFDTDVACDADKSGHRYAHRGISKEATARHTDKKFEVEQQIETELVELDC